MEDRDGPGQEMQQRQAAEASEQAQAAEQAEEQADCGEIPFKQRLKHWVVR